MNIEARTQSQYESAISRPESYRQPYRPRRFRGKSFRQGLCYSRPYLVPELKEWASPHDCRVYSICPHCWHGELVEPFQLQDICREFADRKVGVEFGCRVCDRFGTLLMLTGLLGNLADLNHSYMNWTPGS